MSLYGEYLFRHGVNWLYSLSFMLYPIIGCVVTIVIGTVISLLTNVLCPGKLSNIGCSQQSSSLSLNS